MNEEKTERIEIGIKAGIVGIVFNIVLATFKMVIGTISGSISIIGDSVNNFSDVITSVVGIITFKLSEKPADKKHPFGHERTEYLGSNLVAVIIFIAAYQLVVSSTKNILDPKELLISNFVYIILVGSIVVKIGLYIYYKQINKEIKSGLINAQAMDCLSDCYKTIGVIISIAAFQYLNINIDGYVGLIASILIAKTAIDVMVDAYSKLIGEDVGEEKRQAIIDYVLKYDMILGYHDLQIHTYGPTTTYASLHIEVDANNNTLHTHELIEEIMKNCSENLGINLVLHVDPIIVDDPFINEYRIKVNEVCKAIDESFSIHDFVIIKGDVDIIKFDLIIKDNYVNSKEKIEKTIGDILLTTYPNKFKLIIDYLINY